MKLAVLSIMIAVSSSAEAQTPSSSQILVSASGTAKTPPDMATVGFTLRGEGVTSDEASSKLRDNAKAMRTGVAGLLQKAGEYNSSALSIIQVRSKDCDANSYGPQRLSTGSCAIIGYIALMPVTIQTSRVADAGTLVGLIGRLGGLDANLRGFWLRDDTIARRRAMQAALASAQTQARSIAEGAGSKLGPLLRVQDANYREVTLEMPATAQSAAESVPLPPPPPPAPEAPVRLDLAPEPIQTTVRLMAAYGIDR